jgi:hypothetical protein
MTIQLKKCLHVVLISCAVGILSSSAEAETIGRPTHVYADPTDVVVVLDVVGPCSNSQFFNIERSSLNFKELTAIALMAFSAGKRLGLYVARCAGTRNMVSHGFATN